MQKGFSPRSAGGTGYDRADPAEPTKQRSLDAITPVATKGALLSTPEPLSPVPGLLANLEPVSSEPTHSPLLKRKARQKMKYIAHIPRTLPEGKVLVHSHILLQRPIGWNGSRMWIQDLDDTVALCNCGREWWTHLPHYVPAWVVKERREQAAACVVAPSAERPLL
jgi:hypothetical protein